MHLSIIITSLLAGSISGLVYGLFFVEQKRVLLTNAHSAKRTAFFAIFGASLRIVTLLACWYYLLLTSTIQPILLFISFLITFWVVILNKKA